MNTRWLLKRSGDAPAAIFDPTRHEVAIIPHPGNWAYGWAFDKRVSLAPSMPYPVRVK